MFKNYIVNNNRTVFNNVCKGKHVGCYMDDLLKIIQTMQIPLLLILAGLFFISVGFFDKFGNFLTVSSQNKKYAIPVGLFILILGIPLGFNPYNIYPETFNYKGKENVRGTFRKIDEKLWYDKNVDTYCFQETNRTDKGINLTDVSRKGVTAVINLKGDNAGKIETKWEDNGVAKSTIYDIDK